MGRNRKLLENQVLQDAVIASLVEAVGELGLDGVNVDIEALDPLLIGVLQRLRQRGCGRRSWRPIPTTRSRSRRQANTLGAAMAAAANQAGADRIFLMAYDYRTGASEPGATSPLDRRDGDDKDLQWSLDLYSAVGVPPEKLLLGLPLYGVTWPVVGPEIGAPSTGRGESWILRNHLDLLRDEDAVPQRDEIESVEVYALGSDGSIGPPRDGVARGLAVGVAVARRVAVASGSPAVEPVGRRVAHARDPPRARRSPPSPTANAGGRPLGGGLRRLARDAGHEAGPRPTSEASPAPGSGRSATSAACPPTPT